MMRENESDSGHGWPGPWDYVQHGNLDPWYDRDQTRVRPDRLYRPSSAPCPA